MSRRMLLEDNYRESGLMPVMDGLIGWYDARFRNVDNTYLIDRSNNGNDISCVSNKVIIYDNYINVASDSYSKVLDYTTHINGEFTILYYIDTTKTQMGYNLQLKCMSGFLNNSLGWWIRPGANNINVWYKSRKYINDDDSKTKMPEEKIMVAMVLSSTKVSLYVNGVLFVSNSLNNINIKELSLGLLGHESYKNLSSYKYYSSYVYNRALTEEEIQQNYLYEQSIERG